MRGPVCDRPGRARVRRLGILIERLAYRPLRDRPKLTVLITAIGVSLFLEYTCQHPAVFGARPGLFPNCCRSMTFIRPA